MTLIFDNSFRTLPEFWWEDVRPTPIKNARLVHVSDDLGLEHETFRKWVNGEVALPGEQRIATRYAGHQFGVWAGQLGDGRAISLGEILLDGRRMEIQTKGSGLTPFSRMGDGKAVVRSSVREYLASKAMLGLGIPTTDAIALLIGEDAVRRETIERSAVVVRTFPSNLRFGHFEMAYHFGKETELEALVEYTRLHFFEGASVEEMLAQVIERTAKLIAQWMAVGFCHGVMNTDNMSILGLTIDYGPYGFMEDTNLNHICNHSDPNGRYSYAQQPSIGMWNLERLLVCFIKLVDRATLEKLLGEYPRHFEKEFRRLGAIKIGVDDWPLFQQLLQTMGRLNLDFTWTFRSLSTDMGPFFEYYGERPEFMNWYARYSKCSANKPVNPKFVLRNYIAQEVIDDLDHLKSWLEILSSPYEDHAAFEKYARPTPPEFKNSVVSCSS